MDLTTDQRCTRGRIIALECIIRSQLVDRALEKSSAVAWLSEIRDAMQRTLRQSQQVDDNFTNEDWSEGSKALDEIFRTIEAEVNANLERTPREFPCD